MPKGLSKLILIIALLLAQASVLAHELDLAAHQTGDACEVCLLHSGLDTAQGSAPINLPVGAPCSLDLVCLTTPLINRTATPFQPRAPPQITTVLHG
jgi:hypothetical protein